MLGKQDYYSSKPPLRQPRTYGNFSQPLPENYLWIKLGPAAFVLELVLGWILDQKLLELKEPDRVTVKLVVYGVGDSSNGGRDYWIESLYLDRSPRLRRT